MVGIVRPDHRLYWYVRYAVCLYFIILSVMSRAMVMMFSVFLLRWHTVWYVNYSFVSFLCVFCVETFSSEIK